MKKLILYTMFLFLSFTAYSQITSTQNGNWSDTNTWAGGSVPGASDAVVIAHDVSCASAQGAASLTVNNGKTLTLTKDGALTVGTTVTNNGTIVVTGAENESGSIIATDADDAGQAMAEEIARRIGKDKVYKVHYPEGCKDANDVLLKHGRDGVDTLITSATPWPVAGLFDAKHFFDDVDEIYEKGIGSGASTGYANVDELYSVVEGQLTVVTGHPSSGKSEFIDQLMVNLSEKYGWRFAICSFENEPRIHIAKLVSKYLRLPFFDGRTPRMTKEDLEGGKQFVQSNFSFLYQADGTLSSVDSIIDRLKIAVLRHGVRGAVIDPYNYIQKDRGDVSETEWVSDVLTRLRVFAQAHGIHLWFVAHPTKMMRDANGDIPAPKGYDISGSAAWFAKADVGLTVHRPDPAYSPISEVHIWKCRFSWAGKQGKTELSFDSPTSTYHLPYATSVASTSHDLDLDIDI